MSHTMKFDTPEYGEVRVHYNADWSGRAAVTYQEDGQPREAYLPASVLVRLGQETAKRAILQRLHNILEDGLLDSAVVHTLTGPTFNHTRADGLYNPCPECLAQMSVSSLRKLVRDLQDRLRAKGD